MTASPASHSASLRAVAHANTVSAEPHFSSRWLEASGLLTHAVTSGSGQPILFVHGFPSFWYCWIRQMEALRHAFQVVALDALGAGGSFQPAEMRHYKVASLVGWLSDVIEELFPGQRPILVGHDWGAALAFAFAQACPKAISGVVGIAAPPYSQFIRLVRHDPDQQRRSAYMHDLRMMNEGRAAAVALPLIRAAYSRLHDDAKLDATEVGMFEDACGDPKAFLGGCNWYRANLGSDAAAIIPAPWVSGTSGLTVASLLIWGNSDETFVSQAPQGFLADNPGARVMRLDGIGHWCMLQAPGAVTDAISRFALERTAT